MGDMHWLLSKADLLRPNALVTDDICSIAPPVPCIRAQPATSAQLQSPGVHRNIDVVHAYGELCCACKLYAIIHNDHLLQENEAMGLRSLLVSGPEIVHMLRGPSEDLPHCAHIVSYVCSMICSRSGPFCSSPGSTLAGFAGLQALHTIACLEKAAPDRLSLDRQHNTSIAIATNPSP